MNSKNIFFLSISIIVSSFILGFSFKNILFKTGTVIVKGASERSVIADKALWNISFVSSGNNLNIVNNKIIVDIEKVKNFLKKFKLNEEEINIGQLEFIDMDSREYRDPNQKNRFILTQTIFVESNNIDAIEKANQNLLELIKINVYLKDTYGGNKPIYIFTKLNQIKNSMIDEAITNAKISANQFAKNSNTKIGKIKNANQGVFTISSKKKNYENNEIYEKEKEVRVVSTFEYYLK